ncbi:cytochrome P450, partial [Fomitiporia mediterranea MF3/22]|uniref:cytochrome P450 n=1 Tax=Fomitiporia mediterranea (strain MF3/22) TaxID=694068 RepID=UPI0004408438
EWVSRPVMQVVGRASNRVFVGLPLCRNKDYPELNVQFTINVMKAAQVIRMFPGFMKGIVGELLTSTPASTRCSIKHLAPIIEYCLKQREKHSDEWPGKPASALLCGSLIDEAPNDKQRSVEGLTQCILTMNFAAIHTSSNSFTHALLHLAAHPDTPGPDQDRTSATIAPMREEAEHVIESDGWTKLSIQNMRNIDSFLKESMRFNGLETVPSMTRKALVDYKLSDGTVLPKGSFVSCNALAMHRNDGVYADASEFRPFRFADLRDESAEEATRHQLVSTSNEFLTFGHRRHACPGRFFAANELKAMMAYLVLNYDIKLQDGQDRPKDLEFEAAVVPNPKAHVLFRKRQT